MKQRKTILIIAFSLSFCLLLFGGYKLLGYSMLIGKHKTIYTKPIITGHEGEPLPNIEIFLPDSVSYANVSDIAAGKPTVLFYFGPYCPYCQAEMDEIINNIEYLKNIQFYLITPYHFSDMKAFYIKNNLEKYNNIIIGKDYKFKFGEYFKTQGVPYLAIYTKDRKLQAAFLGNVSHNQIKSVSE